MALSGREVLLILRARDEATRTIGRVSGAMRRMDRDATTSSAAMVNAQRDTLRKLHTQLGDVNHAYRTTAAESLSRHRSEMRMTGEQLAQVRAYSTAVRNQANDQMRAAHESLRSGRISRQTYENQIRDIRQVRDTNLRSLADQKTAIDNVRRASIARHQIEMDNARALHMTQQEQIRQERLAANERIRMYEAEEERMRINKELLRDRGRMLVGMGTGAIATGTAMTYMGIQGVRAWASVTKSSMDYEQQARRTLTQVDNNATSLRKVADIGKEIAEEVPVAFEEIQPALYDIFSSIDVGVGGARKLLKQFAKDAVAGQTQMSVATRANLAIMNAWKLEVEDASEVSDFMFQLVRKGVGSYDEFARSIGRAIPSARRAGQTYQQLGAMMAFLTRNGLSTAMAATSAARALDAVSHPSSVANMKELGITVQDAKGEFLPLVDILDQLNDKFGEMTAPQRSKALYELFKGSGGTIQARRFFDNYFKNADEFNQRTREMANTAGEAGKAFRTMAESPQAKLQALQNDWMLLRIELGERFMPIAIAIMQKLNDWIDWFQNLDPEVKNTIVRIAALVTGLTLLGGVLTVGTGVVMLYVGAINMLGMSAVKTTGKVAGLAVGVGGMVASMGMIDKEASTGQKALGVLGSTASGVVGGAGFGPWGAVIGGAVGLLGGLYKVITSNSSTMDQGASDAQQMADSINAIANASGRAKREEALRLLQSQGMISMGNRIGISTQAMIAALLGNEKAIKEVNKAWLKNGSIVEGLENQKLNDFLYEQGILINKAENEIKDYDESLKRYSRTSKNEVPAAVRKVNEALSKVGKVKPDMGPFKDFYMAGVKGIEDSSRSRAAKLRQFWLSDTRKTRADLKPMWFDIMTQLNVMGRDSNRQNLKNMRELMMGTRTARADMGPMSSDLLGQLQGLQGRAGVAGTGVGNAIGSGITQGIGAYVGAAMAQAAALVGNAIRAARERARAQSPSKEMMDLGKDMGEGLAIGIAAKRAQNRQEAGKLARTVIKQLVDTMKNELPRMGGVLDIAGNILDKRKNLKAAQRKNLLQGVARATNDEVRKLVKVAKQFRDVSRDLDKARADLQKIQEQKRSYIQNVESTIKTYGSFSSFGTNTDVFGRERPATLQSIQEQLAKRLATVKEFGSNLKALLAAGYSKAIYDMVVQLGPEAGNEYAKALLSATPSDVTALNKTVGELNTTASSIASTAGSAMYDAGIKTAEGLIAGLERKERDLRKVAERLGKIIASEIRRALKMRSPSRVGLDIGQNFGASLARGLKSQARSVSRASNILATAAQFDPSTTTSQPPRAPSVVGGYRMPATGAYMREPIKQINQKIDIHTQEIDPRRHAAQLGFELANRTPL